MLGICGGCGRVLWLSRITFDVVNHLFVVVYGCGPHDNVSRKLSYLCCECVLWLSRVTFDVVNDLFVVVCGCGPHDKLKS